MALTTEQIHAAANFIDAQGQRPTLAAIRTKLGTGSFSTIQEAMKSWEKPASEADTESTNTKQPDDLRALLDEAGGKIWALAVRLAKSEFDQEREAAQEKADSTTQELTLCKRENEELMQEIDQLTEKNEDLTKRCHEHFTKFQTAAAENVDLKYNLKHWESTANEREKRLDEAKKIIEALLAAAAKRNQSQPAEAAGLAEAPPAQAAKAGTAAKTEKAKKSGS